MNELPRVRARQEAPSIRTIPAPDRTDKPAPERPPPRRNRRWLGKLLILMMVAALPAGAVWYGWLRPPAVTVALVRQGPAVEAVYANGTVEPVLWARIEPLIAARIVEVVAREREPVVRGQVLARLDDGEQRARVAELSAAVAFLQHDLDRIDELARRNVSSSKALDKARMDLDQAEAALRAARRRLEEFVLTAPIDGIVLQRDAEIGDMARPDKVLFWIGEPRPLRARVDVDEEDIPKVTLGQAVLLKADAFPGRALPGTVAEIRPKGDPVNKNYRVRVALPDDTPLLIGMTVEANIVIRRTDRALLVPDTAVNGHQVFVVEAGIARRRTIQPGVTGDGLTEVRNGLTMGDAVIIAPPASLEDGATVRPSRAGE